MTRTDAWLALALMAVAVGACRSHPPVRRSVEMVAMPPPAEAPHAQASVSVGGSVTFEADEVVSCAADVPDLVRAYATASSLTLVGRAAGRTTLEIRIQTGDIFFLDVDVTADEPARRALAVGDQLALPLAGVKDTSVSGNAITTSKSSDETQLFVTAAAPGIAIVVLQLEEAGTRPVDILVVGGKRVL